MHRDIMHNGGNFTVVRRVSGIVSKRLDVSSTFSHHLIASTF